MGHTKGRGRIRLQRGKIGMHGAVAWMFRATLSTPLAGQSEQLGVPVLRSGYFPMYCSTTRGSDDGSTSLPLLQELEGSTGGLDQSQLRDPSQMGRMIRRHGRSCRSQDRDPLRMRSNDPCKADRVDPRSAFVLTLQRGEPSG